MYPPIYIYSSGGCKSNTKVWVWLGSEEGSRPAYRWLAFCSLPNGRKLQLISLLDWKWTQGIANVHWPLLQGSRVLRRPMGWPHWQLKEILIHFKSFPQGKRIACTQSQATVCLDEEETAAAHRISSRVQWNSDSICQQHEDTWQQTTAKQNYESRLGQK